MPPPALPLSEILDRLLAVFRAQGYDGASLSRLAAATGLVRASLYHRFPNGKQDMAQAVLDRAGAEVAAEVLAPLRVPGDPTARLRAMAQGLKQFYRGGTASCLVELFGIGEAGEMFHDRLAQGVNALVQAITQVLVEAGQAPEDALRRAEDAVIAVHGALVVSRATGTTAPFERVIAELPVRLLS